ncbi:hypothetical protein QJS10_CPB12g00980 [Acorus calamus]|uniref:Uncharacterized protein n=1 Tax=Acorus calamus TaxID=4465 RepID=A0AAV9DMW3_ACOCL|nr:hypothetical protein QJS10_CPB12g00980 [Acorus calamus]
MKMGSPLLFVPLILLPLHLFSSHSHRPTTTVRCAAVLLLLVIPALSSSIVASSSLSTDNRGGDAGLKSELDEMKLKIVQLESVLEGKLKNLDLKAEFVEEKNGQMEEMTRKIQFLQDELLHLKETGDEVVMERIEVLQEEVWRLWAESRKNHFDIHVLETRVSNCEEQLEGVTARVEKMQSIVNEQWMQIGRLEQALHSTNMRTLARMKLKATRCTFFKFFQNFHQPYLKKAIRVLSSSFSEDVSTFSSFISQASHQFRNIMSAARKYHHELQGSVREAIVGNELTASFVNDELIFFLASAIILFPIMSAWIFISSSFG